MVPFDTTTARADAPKSLPSSPKRLSALVKLAHLTFCRLTSVSLFPLLESLPTWPLGCHGGVKTQYLFDSFCHTQAAQHVHVCVSSFREYQIATIGRQACQVASKRDLVQEVLDTLQIAAMIFWESLAQGSGESKTIATWHWVARRV